MTLQTELLCTDDQIRAFLKCNETIDYLPKDRDGYVINLVDEVTLFEHVGSLRRLRAGKAL